ncbi:manganese efflux pump [uncultured Tyzzerella sp.]|uniref:manganese efflux pump n=1 Tax=uncultured Tyzzerella sp. TaxID=2321398 RepID=UPI0029426789|nr:manganese efflux pump [uncultured Tyzzerella sp.]
MILQLLILALALSIDAFGIGISYGVRKINFKISSLAIISFIALLFSSVSIWFGGIISSIFSEKITSFISILILVILGLFIIKKGLEKDDDVDNVYVPTINSENKNIYSLFIKSLGITINIIKTPSICDLNKSLKIDPKEAFYLGIALSLDCIATSIAICSFKGYAFLFPIFIVIFQLTFLLLGTLLGKKTIIKCLDENKISITSGLILIIIGFLRLIFYK